MENVTFAQFKDFIIVATAILAFVVLFGNVWKTIKEWRKPGVSEAEWRRDVDKKLGNDNERIAALEEGNKVQCKAMIAILSHLINGNSKDKLTSAMSELQEYLIER